MSKHKGPAVIESMTKFRLGMFTVRVWRTESEVKESYDNTDLRIVAQSLLTESEMQTRKLTITNIVDLLGRMPRVSAVEVLREDGNGVVTYQEWP